MPPRLSSVICPSLVSAASLSSCMMARNSSKSKVPLPSRSPSAKIFRSSAGCRNPPSFWYASLNSSKSMSPEPSSSMALKALL